MLDTLSERFLELSNIEYFTFGFNIFVYLFSSSIVSHHRDIDEDTIRSKNKISTWIKHLGIYLFYCITCFSWRRVPSR